MPKAGKTSLSARDYHCIQARARTDESDNTGTFVRV